MPQIKIKSALTQGIKSYFRVPLLPISGAVLWAILLGLSKISETVNYHLTNTPKIIIWLAIFFFIQLSLFSLFSSVIILVSKERKSKSFPIENILHAGGKFYLRNLLALILVVALSAAIGRATHIISFFVGNMLLLDVKFAQGIFFFVYFVLAALALFIMFPSFFIVTLNSRFVPAVKKSAGFVKNNYLLVLSFSIAVFIVLNLLNYLPQVLASAVEYIIILPLSVSIFTQFITSYNDLRAC